MNIRNEEKELTIQVMFNWYEKFCQSRHYSKLKKTAQKKSERAILDLLCVMYYELKVKPNNWSSDDLQKYCDFLLVEEVYNERDENYFKYASDILLAFFMFLRDNKLHKNAESIIEVIERHGANIYEYYEEHEKSLDYSDETAIEVVEETTELIINFLKSKYYDDLSDLCKEHCENIILNFSQSIYSYTCLRPKRWSSRSLEEVCLDVMPRKIVADNEYFESISPVLNALFLFMKEQKINPNIDKLIERINIISDEIISASKKTSNFSIGKQLLNSAVEKGIDISSKSKLAKFLNSMIGKPIENINDDEYYIIDNDSDTEEYEYQDNIIPFVRKTEK